MERREKIRLFLTEQMQIPLKKEELAVLLDVPAEELNAFYSLLSDMEEKGEIAKTKKQKYTACENLSLFRGTFCGTQKGFGFVTVDGEEDFFVPKTETNGALHGDTVLVKKSVSPQEGRRQECSVVKIIGDMPENLCGRIVKRNGNYFVISTDSHIPAPFFVANNHLLGAKADDFVLFSVIRRAHNGAWARAQVTKTIGSQNTPGADISALVLSYRVAENFPEEVLEDACIAANKSIDDLQNRRDLRDMQIITIDGEDAKDLDDAVSLKQNDDGTVCLGVHIADVSHYVPLNSALDKEAVKRGTSIYLPDRVIPMLPQVLSNGVCSLNAGADRLTLSVFMQIDEHGNRVGYEIVPSVIRSCHRMTYNNVQRILNGDADACETYRDIVSMVEQMDVLRKRLNLRRRKRGSVNFETDEARFVIDENGKIADIQKRERLSAHNLIEEFMLAANCTVAEHLFWVEAPCIYRVHPAPDTDDVLELAQFVNSFGYTLKHNNGVVHPGEIAQLTEQTANTPEETVIHREILRTMAKAYYDTECASHFGLAFEKYCHFTSPIRRLPDLCVHRILKASLDGQVFSDTAFSDLQTRAERSSQTERTAQALSREAENMKLAEYMQQFIGETFTAVISGISVGGIYATLENTVEGRIAVADLKDDYYVYNEKQKTPLGERTGRVFSVGDSIEIRVAACDKMAGQIDFVLKETTKKKNHSRKYNAQKANTARFLRRKKRKKR